MDMSVKRLTILHINKVHHMLGGAESVYFTTSELLERHGHKSIFFSVRHPCNTPTETEGYFAPYIDLNKNKGLFNHIKASLNVFYSFKSRKHLARLLDNYTVDIAHIHNIHRQMSPSILHELKRRGIPIIMTLHEYKMICPSFLLLAHGKPCEACSNGRYYNAIRRRCVKGRFMRSLLASLEAYLHFKIMDIYKNVDIFIVPSLFLMRKHEEMGFKGRMVHLPYPLDLRRYDRFKSSCISCGDDRIRIAYFGRLVKEKGLLTLTDAIVSLSRKGMEQDVEFSIIGEGQLRKEMEDRLRGEGIKNVNFMGFLLGDSLYEEIAKMHIIVIPSEWYENYPVSVMEAFAMGKPVIGSNIGGIPEFVKHKDTGLIFKAGNSNDLCEKIEYLVKNKEEITRMGKNARSFAERVFDAELHYPRLIEIYGEVMRRHEP